LNRGKNILARLEAIGRISEDALLVIILSGMILLAASQIVLRNFLNIGFIWGDELLRMLVLWIAVAGAVAASRSDKHISIAVLDRFLPEKVTRAIKTIIHLFTSVICGIVSWHSFIFVQTSYEFGDVLLGGVPAWLLQAILPVGFGLITWRYLLFTIKGLRGQASRAPAS
jgi:TRAP-type C4-dicarboxylate transport system permease small subunit